MNIKDMIVAYNDPIPTRSVDSVLPVFYRDILRSLPIDEGRFLVCVDKYVRRTSTSIEDLKEVSSIRGNLRKELMRSVMTWKVFIKGLRVINVKSFDLGLKVEFQGSDNETPATTSVTYRVNLEPKTPTAQDEIHKTDQLLAKMFKDVMFNTGITMTQFMRLLADYIHKTNTPINAKEVSSTRGNLKKELFKPTISWKVFVKALAFLQVRRFTLGIYLHHPNGKITEHLQSVSLDVSSGYD